MTVLRPPQAGSDHPAAAGCAAGTDTVLVLAEDLTEASRVDAVRRDFVVTSVTS